MTKKAKTSKNKAKDVETSNRKISVTLKDRVLIPGLLPKEADIVTMTIAKDISKKVAPTQPEILKSGMVVNKDGSISWKKNFAKDIGFTAAELELLKKQIDLFDSQKKITADTLDTCVKIRG